MLGRIQEAHVGKTGHKKSDLIQKLKELEAEAEDDEEIVSNFILQADSDNSNKSRDHIITNSTVVPVLICHTGYNIPMIVHSLEPPPLKKDRYNNCFWLQLEKRNMKMTWC